MKAIAIGQLIKTTNSDLSIMNLLDRTGEYCNDAFEIFLNNEEFQKIIDEDYRNTDNFDKNFEYGELSWFDIMLDVYDGSTYAVFSFDTLTSDSEAYMIEVEFED